MMKNVRNRLRLEFIKKYEFNKIIEQRIKLTFNGIHLSYQNCDSYSFKQNEVLMDRQSFFRVCCIRIK